MKMQSVTLSSFGAEETLDPIHVRLMLITTPVVSCIVCYRSHSRIYCLPKISLCSLNWPPLSFCAVDKVIVALSTLVHVSSPFSPSACRANHQIPSHRRPISHMHPKISDNLQFIQYEQPPESISTWSTSNAIHSHWPVFPCRRSIEGVPTALATVYSLGG